MLRKWRDFLRNSINQNIRDGSLGPRRLQPPSTLSSSISMNKRIVSLGRLTGPLVNVVAAAAYLPLPDAALVRWFALRRWSMLPGRVTNDPFAVNYLYWRGRDSVHPKA
jgi:hypothetical protein